MVILLASLYLPHTILEGLSISSKGLREIIRTEIRSPRTVNMITSSCGQCHKGTEVSKVNNIKRKITCAMQGLPRMF